MSGSDPHISRLIASPSITTTKCALKRRCVTSMLIRLALRSLRRAPQRAGGAAGSLDSSAAGLRGSALVREWICFSVRAPGNVKNVRRRRVSDLSFSELFESSHEADHESKEGGGQSLAAAGQEVSLH